uniref:mitogen-activated protein kinase kinase n=1 Tax=Aegilops tauschii TaxID=37682 RepID=M8CHS4_AEGTA
MDRKIVHRDTKPGNTLVDDANRVKIADLGIEQSSTLARGMNGGRYDVYAPDIWPFRLTVLELYLGRYPYGDKKQLEGQGVIAIVERICYTGLPRPPSDNASPKLTEFLSLCL